MVKWLVEILEVPNIELKASNYSIKRSTVDDIKDLHDNRKDFGKRKDLYDRELSSLWCSKGTYSHYFLQGFILFRLNLV